MDIKARAKEILEQQATAVSALEISNEMLVAIDALVAARKDAVRIVTTGMGKAGIIAMKMSATLASIGFPSFYVNPAEGGHGDLGRIAPKDLVVAFSNSGSTSELLSMIQHLHALNERSNKVIIITGNDDPVIPDAIIVSYGKVTESCIVSKVPSTSTTVMLVIADVLAITAAESVGLDDSWFKARHPGGAIGVAYKKEATD